MAKRGTKTPAVPVRGGWDVLPHAMGSLRTAASPQSAVPTAPVMPVASSAVAPTVAHRAELDKTEAASQSADHTPSSTNPQAAIAGIDGGPEIEPRSRQPTQSKRKASERIDDGQAESVLEPQPKSLQVVQVVRRSTRSTRSKYSTPITESHHDCDLPLAGTTTAGTLDAVYEGDQTQDQESAAGPTKRSRRAKKKEDDGDFEDLPKKTKRVPRKTKDNPYGLTPGTSPFPDWQSPSADQCREVYRILADMHDDVQPQAPEVIPAPSLEVTGCGEVPYVLEALIRTLLSGAVTFAGAAKMLQGIIRKFGVLGDGPAKGSIDWNKIRLSSMEEVVEAIREGGLANNKAKSIKGILDMVHQENLERREAYLAERQTGVPANVYGASDKTESQKDLEILKTEQNILSLDHMRGLCADEAMRQFTKYPGVGVKTSACVILFCLQRPCFAVDTHVHKFSRWLGWAPEKADENDVFSHLEVRCPDHLKYGLHQLFIRHGQTCGRCKKITAEGTKEWDAIVCPLEHLLVRSGKRQAKPKPPKARKKVKQEDEADAEAEGLYKAEGQRDIGEATGESALLPEQVLVAEGVEAMEDKDTTNAHQQIDDNTDVFEGQPFNGDSDSNLSALEDGDLVGTDDMDDGDYHA